MIKSRAKQKTLTLMAHQAVSVKHGRKQKRVYDVSDTGTGKTAVAISLFAERRRRKGGCALITCPRSLMLSAWAADFKKFAPDMKVSVASADNRADAFAVDADVYITNHDAVKWIAQQKKTFFAKFSEWINDECTAYKNHSSQRSRAAAKIAKHFEFRRGMTATPNGRSITDVWHQVFLLDDGERLGPQFYAFRSAVCEPKQVGRDVRAITWSDKEGAEEAVFNLLSDIVIRHRRDDCLDLPPNHQYEIPFTMSRKIEKAYDEMFNSAVLTAGKGKLTAVHASAVVNKVLQIGSGAVYDNDGKVVHICDSRYELVMDLIEARKHSLAFYLWDHQREAFEALAAKRGVTFCTLSSTMPDAARAATVQAYQAGRYQVMFAHPKNAAHGLTLTRGTATIWPGPIHDLELWVQGNGRQQRIGQTEKTETIVLLADNNAVEHRVFHEILMPKGRRMGNLLDLFAGGMSNLDLAA